MSSHPAGRTRRLILKKLLPAGLVLVLSVCVLLMTGIQSLLFAAQQDPEFPRLSENLAASRHLEVRRQIKGNIQAMFALPERNEVIVAADGYLWRFSADGRLLDTVDTPGAMHRNGISFGDDGFIDWVHTGMRSRKPYAPPVDGNALEPAQLHAALSAAKVVAFDRRDDRAWAWLWDGDTARKMDISRHRERVDTYCTSRSSTDDHLSWADTCLEGLEVPTPLMVEIEADSFAAGYGGRPSRVEVVGFDRRRYHVEGGVARYAAEIVVGGAFKVLAPHLPGGLPRRYWFGDAHTRLLVDGEVLQFKVFVGRDEGDYEFLHMTSWWDPSTVLPGASPWMQVHMRDYMEHEGEEELWQLYREDLGLYAVRPRQSARDPAAPARPTPAWVPAFDGPETARDAVTGTVVLEGGATVHRWWRARPARPRISAPTVALDADGPPLNELPTAMQVEWGSPWDDDSYAIVEVTLDPAQTRAAFARLPAADVPATLLLQVPDLFGEVGDMRLLLRRAGTDVPLDHARLEYLRRPTFRPWHGREGAPPPPTRVAQLKQSADDLLAGEGDALARFQLQAETLVRDPDIGVQSIPFITEGYARLLNGLNSTGRADTSVALVRHYLSAVHPYTSGRSDDPSAAYNTSVIASQTLAVAVRRPQDAALVDEVIATLVGPQFDPDTHTNATLLYNLACHYALQGDKPRMLRHVSAAARLGKPAEQFRNDADFERYLDDPEFEAAVSVP
ncbi:MAG: TPR end-of-group domain-containing protein [Lysobacter sp.]